MLFLIAFCSLIAIAVIVEHGGSGSRTAAPMARKLMDYYLLDNWLSEKNLGVDLLVNPEFECALQIRNLLNVPGASDVAEFGGGQAVLVGLTVQENASCVGEPLHEVKLKLERHDFLVASVTRGDYTIIPRRIPPASARSRISTPPRSRPIGT